MFVSLRTEKQTYKKHILIFLVLKIITHDRKGNFSTKIGLSHFLVSDLICLSSLLPVTTFLVRDNRLFIPQKIQQLQRIVHAIVPLILFSSRILNYLY